MAHSRLACTTMLDWIERCLTYGQSMPTDAEICQRYGIESPEGARTLLAELADAGKITITGYGDDRWITLGRAKSTIVPAARPQASVTRADPAVDRAAAKIAAILRRPRRQSASAPIVPPCRPLQEDHRTMPAKSVQLPASAAAAIAALERHAESGGLSMGAAAADLIERGAERVHAEDPGPAASPAPRSVSVTSIVTDIQSLFDELVERADRSSGSATALVDRAAADVAAAVARAVAAEARADAAEEKLAKLKSIFA